ncbi:MAG TPA: hypothetical protein VNA25_06770 [Phycisphaerae bacterium]|nr:hypothetical protein [Phycisphaerae bacterium]HUT57538.1 hypothetical protein [Phycisphaerae bacterium]
MNTKNAARGHRRNLRACWLLGCLLGVLPAGCVNVLSTTRAGYSPDGRRLAFVTREPADATGLLLKDASAYRLMVISNERAKGMRLIEVCTDAMLCAPTFSPDGKMLCYLRVPLVDQELAVELLGQAQMRAQSTMEVLDRLDSTLAPPDANAPPSEGDPAGPTQPAAQDANRLAEAKDSALAEIGYTYWMARTSPILSAELVFRETRSYRVVRVIPVDVPFISVAMGAIPVPDIGGAIFHGLFQLQFRPDGKWLCLWDGGRVLKVHARSGVKVVVQCAAYSFDLSPDGNSIAMLSDALRMGAMESNEPLRRFARPDGSGMALRWVDNQTLLVPMGDDRLCWVRPDGQIIRSRQLAFEPNSPTASPLFWYLAADPNSGRTVVCAKGQALFLDSEGRLVKRVLWDDAFPVQPAYRPDGKRVAVQVVAHDEEKPDYLRVVAVAYFDPRGNELARVPVSRLPESLAPRPDRDQADRNRWGAFVSATTAPATAPAPPQ